jgi:aspartyl/asparaginyl-tRNA synthetase
MNEFGISINKSRILSFVLLTLFTAGNKIGIERLTMHIEVINKVSNRLVFSRALT